MKNIESSFNDDFANWEICLPPNALEKRHRGKIVQAGWLIWYLFGCDEEGEYLDYYACHRMTSDRHDRIYADGHRSNLPTVCEFRVCSDDPEEDARLKAEYYAENKKIARMLEEKGFGLEGNEPGSVQINRHLHLNEFDQ